MVLGKTTREVMRSLHGCVLLSDKVGLGKTIEACVLLKEYIQHGMVKPEFRKSNGTFWDQPFILTSINQAKSKLNEDAVATREYSKK